MGYDNIPFAVLFSLQGRFGVRPVSEFDCRPCLIEVSEIECPKPTNSHTTLPQYQQDNVPKAGVLVLVEMIEDGVGLFTGQYVVADLVVLADFRDLDQLVEVDWHRLYGLAELDEVFHCPHVVPAGDGLHIGEPPLLEASYFVAVYVSEIGDPTFIEIFEEPFEGRGVVIMGLVADVGFLSFEVAFHCVPRRSSFEFHCYSAMTRRVARPAYTR